MNNISSELTNEGVTLQSLEKRVKKIETIGKIVFYIVLWIIASRIISWLFLGK